MQKILSIIVIISLFFSCETDSKLEQEIASIDVTFNIERFDKLFAKATPESLPELKTEYPFMFSKRYNDSLWMHKINDTLQQQLNLEVEKAFATDQSYEIEIQSLFQHLKYYFKAFKSPRIITVTSDVDYRNKTIVTDTIVLIALDTYLGANHEFYEGIPKYIRQNFESSQIVPDLATQYALQNVYQPKRKTFLDEMIYYGKVLYFKDIMIPFKADDEKIGYTKQQLNWAIDNESYIWRYFVERELLFNTDSQLLNRFINPAPFSKFNLELDGESPGRLGQYTGWQIVKAYMKNNDVTLQKMLNTSAEDIFNNSKFKPRK
ncbi:MAG: gliding motility lipoprotein GldB [Bacteroidetes bacterium]|nr:gliding motility lipoprotein GldB [Bacteroidota bacterium]